MKNQLKYSTDTYFFKVPKPSYDEVNKQMDLLKEQGWTHLEYQEGYTHIGRDQDDNDHTVYAKITGTRKAVKSDYFREIKKLKEEIKKTQEEIKDVQMEIWSRKEEISDMKKQVGKMNTEIKQLEGYIKWNGSLYSVNHTFKLL